MAKHTRRSWAAPALLLAILLAVLAVAGVTLSGGHVSAPLTPPASAPAPQLAPPVISAPAPPRHAEPRRYAVRAGDTLWHIAATRCGDPLRWTSLWHANKIANPDLIFPGEVIVLVC